MPQRHVGQHVSEGFTLVEIAIVLVVIGLVVGGILVGRDLIHSAELRATVSQYEKFNSAVTTFFLKFNGLPGDMPNASDFGFDPTSNGNGDGYIGLCNSSPGCRWPSVAVEHEHVDFFYQLSFAHLIPNHLVTAATANPGLLLGMVTPAAKISSPSALVSAGWGIVSEAVYSAGAGGGAQPAHSFVLATGVAKVPIGAYGAYSPSDSAALDTKMDDGLPLSGKVRAWAALQIDFIVTMQYKFDWIGGVLGIGPGGNSSAVCVRNDTTPNQYNVQYSDGESPGVCGLTFKANF